MENDFEKQTAWVPYAIFAWAAFMFIAFTAIFILEVITITKGGAP